MIKTKINISNMIDTIVELAAYIMLCMVFFNELGYSFLSNLGFSISIVTILFCILNAFNKQADHPATTIKFKYEWVLFLVAMVGPMALSSDELLLGRPAFILSFYIGLYLIIKYCREQGSKPLIIFLAVILSSIFFYLAHTWGYIPFIAVSVLGGFSNDRKEGENAKERQALTDSLSLKIVDLLKENEISLSEVRTVLSKVYEEFPKAPKI